MYPEYIMEAVRQNWFDLEEDDVSRDDDIMKMDKADVFNSYLYWNGIIGYAGSILDAIESIYECDLDEREFY